MTTEHRNISATLVVRIKDEEFTIKSGEMTSGDNPRFFDSALAEGMGELSRRANLILERFNA